jgi:hypothetical protein
LKSLDLHLEFHHLLLQRLLAGGGLGGGCARAVLRSSARAGLGERRGGEQGQAPGAQHRKHQFCLHGDLLFLRVRKIRRTPLYLEAAVLLPSQA